MIKYLKSLSIAILIVSFILAEDLILDGETVTMYGEHTYELVQLTNSTINVDQNTGWDDGRGFLIINADTILIDTNSTINADGAGWIHNQSGAGFGFHATYGAGGAGYGGQGGNGGNFEGTSYGFGGSIYGSNDILQLGSLGGQGDNDSQSNGYGGGAVLLNALFVQIDGIVTANGFAGDDSYYNGCGGGSGGHIILYADSLSLSGLLSVNGGDGEGASSNYDGGGGGGSGRILVEVATFQYSEENFSMLGGTGGEGNSTNGSWDGYDGEGGSPEINFIVESWISSTTNPIENNWHFDPNPIFQFNLELDEIYGYFYQVSDSGDTETADISDTFIQSTTINLDYSESTENVNGVIHAVPVNDAFEILYEYHTSFYFKVRTQPLVITSATHPAGSFSFTNSNLTFNFETLTGLSGYYYLFNNDPESIPSQADPSEAILLTNPFLIIPGVEAGIHWLHLVGVDETGFYSEVAQHRQIIIGLCEDDFYYVNECGLCAGGSGDSENECNDGYIPDCHTGQCTSELLIGDGSCDNGLTCYNNDNGDCGEPPVSCYGCTDESACNFDSLAIWDDDSCIYNVDCNGVCDGIAEVDACGICGGDGLDFDEDSICDSIDDTPWGEVAITIPYYSQNSLSIDYTSNTEIAGFQFDLNGLSLTGAFGGVSDSVGFSITSSGSTVIGFTLTGVNIPAGSGNLINLSFMQLLDSTETYISNAVFSASNGNPQEVTAYDSVIIPSCDNNDNDEICDLYDDDDDNDGITDLEDCAPLDEAASIIDCEGICGGNAVLGDCGCTGGSTGLEMDWCYGCTDSSADNWWCNETLGGQCSTANIDNCLDDCVQGPPPIQLVIPPSELIDDGSCEYLGCSDPNAGNFDDAASNCEGTEPGEFYCCDYDIILSFTNITQNYASFSIDMINSEDVYGFQLDLTGVTIDDAALGIIVPSDWLVSFDDNSVIAFSIQGTFIPIGEGIILDLSVSEISGELICVESPVFSNQDAQFIGTIIGECIEVICEDTDLDDICDYQDDCIGQFDECGVCNGDNSTCSYGCMDEDACNYDEEAVNEDGTCQYPDEFGWCDCLGTLFDCEGTCGGNAEVDDCDVCSGGTTGHAPNSDEDCNGDCFGDAADDSCGVCSGGDSGHDADSDIDCNGDCFGSASIDVCGFCAGENTENDPYIECTPGILNIWDVINDQGGRVFIEFTKSPADTDSLSRDVEIYFIERWDEDPAGTGEGSWINIISGGAYNQDSYIYEATTFVDSNATQTGLTLFRVIAEMEEGTWASEPASGYSVDNIAPGTPESLEASINDDNYIELTWSEVSDNDLYSYIIERSEDVDFSSVEIYESFNNTFIDSDIVMDLLYYYRVAAIDINDNTSNYTNPVSIELLENESPGIPVEYSLLPAYPNPFNPITNIRYALPDAQMVMISIYNITGVEVAQVLSSNHNAGYFSVSWDASSLPSGIYILQFKAGGFISQQKIMLLK